MLDIHNRSIYIYTDIIHIYIMIVAYAPRKWRRIVSRARNGFGAIYTNQLLKRADRLGSCNTINTRKHIVIVPSKREEKPTIPINGIPWFFRRVFVLWEKWKKKWIYLQWEKKNLMIFFFWRNILIQWAMSFPSFFLSGSICPRIETTETHTIKIRWLKMKINEEKIEDFFY